MSNGLQLYGRVLSQTGTALVLDYLVENTGPGEVLVCNRLYRDRTPDGSYVVDPNVAYVTVEPGPRPNVTKRVPERTDDVNVEYPVHPLATRLRPGERFTEQFTVALPLAEVDAYHPLRAMPPTAAVASTGLTLSLGWFARDRVSDLLLPDVNTTAGRLPMVKAAHHGQSIVRVDLDVSVPVVAPGGVVPRRQCPACGAMNAGDQQACLRCGTPLPAPVAPAGPGWRPTHRVPDGGLPTFTAPGGAPSTPLGGGLPVQVVARAGDWVQVVTWTGWSGWVDGRLLAPG